MAHSLNSSEYNSSGEYEGRSLVDRLLKYYAKFEGSRPKAVKYAQKLLDLGHIEGLAGYKVFHDGSQKYRWTDVASVVNSKKHSELSPPPNVAKQDLNKQDRPRRTVRISIETDECEDTEIRAHIRTQPNKNDHVTGTVLCETKQPNGHFFDGKSTKKMLSFTSETSKTEEIMRIVPITPGVTQILENENENKQEEYHIHNPDDNSTIERIGKKEFQSRVLKFRSATHPTIVTFSTSGTAAPSDNFYTENHEALKSDKLDSNPTPNGVTKTALEETSQNNQSDIKHDSNEHFEESKVKTKKIKESRYELTNGHTDESHKVKPEETSYEKCLKVEKESKTTESAVESRNLPFDLRSDIHKSAYSPRKAKEMKKENGESETSQSVKKEDLSFELSPPASPLPKPRKEEKPQQPAGMKSLFWKKIPQPKKQKLDKTFWSDVTGEIPFDKDEFKKLFSKPLVSPRTRRSRLDYLDGNVEGGILKVLSTERSRQVGIRASTVHLAIEDIHDAVTNVDDELLDIDAIQALYDIRPTQAELDKIEIAIKRHPEAILDKPEQLLLMLAMISNLNERLQSWLFVRKFADHAEEIEEHLAAVIEACRLTVKNSTIKHALQTILAFGNFMNDGTQRGDAFGFHFDILPKIKDVKSTNGNLNLLKYIVKMFIEADNSFMLKLSQNNEQEEEVNSDCPLPPQHLLRKAAAVSMTETLQNLDDLSAEAYKVEEEYFPKIIKGCTSHKEMDIFTKKMSTHLRTVFNELDILHQYSQNATKTIQEFKTYFVPEEDDTEKESFAKLISFVEQFCDDFRSMWRIEMREHAKGTVNELEKNKAQRNSSITISQSPTALKKMFMEKRRREAESNVKTIPLYVKREHRDSDESSSRESSILSDEFSRHSRDGLKPENRYDSSNLHAIDSQVNLYAGKARKNSLEIEERMRSMKFKDAMKLRKARHVQRTSLLKAKTC